MRVSIFPNNNLVLNNRLFDRNLLSESQWQGNSHWMDTNIKWKEDAEKKCILLNTYDILPPNEADVVIHIDLPKTVDEILERKKSAPDKRHILILLESPLLPYWFNKKNHQLFDYILTYNDTLVDNIKYFKIFPQISNPPQLLPPANWENRKQCVLLNTNYYRGILVAKSPFHYIKSFFDYKKNGWEFSLFKALYNEGKFLYRKRRKLARLGLESNIIDVYGKGWQGHKHSWYYRFFPDKPYFGNKGLFSGEKLELFQNYRFVITFENYRSDIGYISEKIFDAMYAGAIPVYLGDNRIQNFIPSDCYIDASQFKTNQELIDFIVKFPQEKWEQYRCNIDQFIKSESIEPFLPKSYARAINKIILK